VDIDLGYSCTTFELDGRQVIECLMQALPIVEDFDVFEYGSKVLRRLPLGAGSPRSDKASLLFDIASSKVAYT